MGDDGQAKPDEPKPVDIPTLLKQIMDAHTALHENLQAAPVDGERARAELAGIHHAIRTLAWIISTNYPAPDAHKLDERRLELAKVRGPHLYEGSRLSDKAVLDFAMLGLRSLTVINGAALIAMLTFLGNVQGQHVAADPFGKAFALFVGGLTLALASIVLAYLSQSFQSEGAEAGADKIWFREYRDEVTVAKREQDETHALKWSRRLRTPAIVVAIISAIMFATGCGFGFTALGAFKPDTAQEKAAQVTAPSAPPPENATPPSPDAGR